MVRIDVVDGACVIENLLIFGAQEPRKDLINLASQLGEDTRYVKLDYQLVDYPGEYDINDISIHVFLGNGDKLSYFFQIHGEKVAILQSVDVLETYEELSEAKLFLYTDESILNKLDQLELDGERRKI